jgi:hypothetical protein
MLLAAPQKLLALSLPARVAILTAVFLGICVATAGVAFYFSQDRTPWDVWWRPERIAVIAVLLVVIPLVVYQALRLWLEGDVSRFPDIDYAWKAGLAELTRNGLDLRNIPVFLILGSTGEPQERGLFNATRQSFRVREFPKGLAALHWYANPDAIYLCCTGTSQLSKLATLAENLPATADPAPAEQLKPSPGAVQGTMMFGGPQASQPSLAATAALGGAGAPGGAGGASPDIHGTMMIRGTMMAAGDIGAMMAALARNELSLTPQDSVQQQRRLEYVCRLLRRARQPLCPINGVLTVLPYGAIQRGARESAEVERAVRGDLATLRSGLQLRCPVTALVAGLEQESGFCELVRRAGPDRARGQRFGKGYEVWSPAAPEQLAAVAAHACGAFEDWVYALFREKGALDNPGNVKLYALLCKVRRTLQERLTSILVGGYAAAADAAPATDAMLFGGCYFADTGDADGRQAFIKGVLDKLPDQQEELEWTSVALRQEIRCRRLAYFGVAFDFLLLLALAGMLVHKFL